MTAIIGYMGSELVKKALRQATYKAFKLKPDRLEITRPDSKFGDFASNVGFILANELKLPPAKITEKIAKLVKVEGVERAEAVGGFVNVWMSQDFWIKQLGRIDKNYAKENTGKGTKVQVEFISANPTGPLTLGNARGGYIGDCLANVLAHAGFSVTREYYFNDTGTQILSLVESVKAAAGLLPLEKAIYKGKHIDELARQFLGELQNKSDGELGKMLTNAIFKQLIKPTAESMGINFDVWFNERELVESGQTTQAIERLRGLGLVYEKDGATWLAASKITDDERDRVLIKSNKELTYLVNDIPYHIDIFEKRKFEAAIKILGADHHGQVSSLKLALKQIFPDKKLEVVLYQLVRVVHKGEGIRMSKRAGTFVTVDDLLSEIESDVARFFFLMHSSDSPMDFDLGLAKERTQRNPYYYVMYSYARANSILDQARSRKLIPRKKVLDLNRTEALLVRQMSLLPELVIQIAKDYEVHRLTFFGLEIAKKFHDLYESENIINLEKAKSERKLYLIQQYLNFMEIYFKLLGIKPVKRMIQEPTKA